MKQLLAVLAMLFALCLPDFARAQDVTLDFPSWQDWLKGNKYNFTDPGVVAAMEQFRKSLSYAPPGTNSAVARQLFIDGKAAFLRDGPWVWATLQKAKPEIRPSLKTSILTPTTMRMSGHHVMSNRPMCGIHPRFESKNTNPMTMRTMGPTIDRGRMTLSFPYATRLSLGVATQARPFCRRPNGHHG